MNKPNKPKLNEPDVEISLTAPQGESISINKTLPSQQFENYIKNYINDYIKPTEEEIIQEANKLGYEYKNTIDYIELTKGFRTILIDKEDIGYTTYDNKFNVGIWIDCEEHKLITKILTYLELGGL